MELSVTQSLGESWKDLAAIGTIPEKYRTSYDDLGKLGFIHRGMSKLLQVIYTTIAGQGMSVSDPRIVSQELYELDRTISVRVASTDTNHTKFGVTNYQAAQLPVNTILLHKSLFKAVQFNTATAAQVDPSNTVLANLNWETGKHATDVKFSRTWGVDNAGNWLVDQEQMIVKAVGEKDSAGTGYTTITVQRCFCGPHSKDKGGMLIPTSLVNTAIQANTADCTLAVGDVLLKGIPSWGEGTGLPGSIFKNPDIDINYLQEYKYAVRCTRESMLVETRGMKQLDMNRMLTSKTMVLEMERTMIGGQKGVTGTTDGREQFLTGGIAEFVPKDRDHIISYKGAGLNYMGLLDMTNEVFVIGGAPERDLFCGYSLFTELKKAYYDTTHMVYDPEASANFDMPIESIMGAGGKIRVHPSYTLEEMGWKDRALCLDLSEYPFIPMTLKGLDMQVTKDVGSKEDEIYVEKIVGYKGLKRTRSEYQTMFKFPQF